MDQYAWSTRLLSWFLLSYDGSFAREWILKHITKHPGAYFSAGRLASFQFTGAN
jgi:hypothetical protein